MNGTAFLFNGKRFASLRKTIMLHWTLNQSQAPPPGQVGPLPLLSIVPISRNAPSTKASPCPTKTSWLYPSCGFLHISPILTRCIPAMSSLRPHTGDRQSILSGFLRSLHPIHLAIASCIGEHSWLTGSPPIVGLRAVELKCASSEDAVAKVVRPSHLTTVLSVPVELQNLLAVS